MKHFKKIAAIVSLITLCLWLMPLGAFIKPSQEDTACGGKRAFHMCCMLSGKVRPEGIHKVCFYSMNSSERTAKSSAAGGDDFVTAASARANRLRAHLMELSNDFFYPQYFQEIPEPPPKTALFF